MESVKEFKDFLSLPFFCAKLVGIDPTRGPETFRFKLSCLALAIGVINHLYLMLGELVYFHRHIGEFTSLLEATKTGAYIAYGINTNTKVFAVLSDLSLLKNVLRTIEELYPKSLKEKRAFRVNENFWSISIYLLVATYFLAGWSTYFMPGIKSIYQYMRFDEEFSYETPFWVEHPFYYQTKLLYGLVYFSELWGGHLCVSCNIGIDLLLCCLSRQMSMHFKYIGKKIEQYCPTGKPEDSAFFGKLIEQHQLILKLCLDLNEIFGISLVFNFFSSSGIICLSAFQVTVEGPGMEFMKFFLLLISALGQLFIVCSFGNELIESSLSIIECIFNHPWYRGSQSYKKQLVIFILRCQKPATLIAKGYSVVSLVTFKQVSSMSYRIFALLNTFHTG
ncbi:putative odorant receptor 85d [Episyrphus balteatus]|uniref:putative odorant receptor 85d n=1 Tax=Episyrphus balteatus TaxID=286459 RepID=UPI0024856900|nr:putative odorant receptor 85d [Episyrphus balteatus]